MTSAPDGKTYAYDAMDRLIDVDLPDTTHIDYTYDWDGRRIQKDVDSGTEVINYLWDEFSTYGDVVLETDDTNAVLGNYTLANSQLISQTRNSVDRFYLADGQGSIRALVDDAGTVNVTDNYTYKPFGEILISNETTENSYQYTGQQFDEHLGLYSLRVRYYEPTAGRFLTRDKLACPLCNPMELNRYGYTANAPINYYDPTGQSLVGKVTSLIGSMSLGGALIGGISGFIGTMLFHTMASAGLCGDHMKKWADDADVWGLAAKAAVIGTLTGAVTGGLSGTVAARTGAVFGGLGLGVSVTDMLHNGVTWCNGLTAALSVVGPRLGKTKIDFDVPMDFGNINLDFTNGVLVFSRTQVASVTIDWSVGAVGAINSTAVLSKKNPNRGDADDYDDYDGYGSPQSQAEQKRQFNQAVKKINKILGRKITKSEQRRLHDAITGEGYTVEQIVDEGLWLFKFDD